MMGEKTKYLIIILTAILLSTAASYITTTLTMQNIQSNLEQQINQQQQPPQNTTKTKVNFEVKGVEFEPDMIFNMVSTNPNVSVDNLTIVYRYTCLNSTVITESIDYGSYYPAWSAGSMIYSEGIPDVSVKIPDYIIHASSSTMVTEHGALIWDVYPQVEVLEIYGYAESIA